MKHHYFHSSRTGLTRIEVVVLVLVIFLMLALLFPFIAELGRSPDHRGVQCKNNIRQLGLAMSNVASMRGEYPSAQYMNQDGEVQYGWRIAILPQLEQMQMYEHIMQNPPWDNEQNRQYESTLLSGFACPSYPDLWKRPGRTSYTVIVGPDTPFEGNRRSTFDDFERGLSHTILIAETSQSVPWMEPVDLPYANLNYGIVPLSSKQWSVGSGHDGAACFVTADGSVQTLNFSKKPDDVAELKRMTWLKEPKQ